MYNHTFKVWLGGVWDFSPAVPNERAARHGITVVVFLLMILGLFWNLLILTIVIKRRLYTKHPTIVLLINLAIINIVVCIFVIPLNIAAGIKGGFNFGGSDAARWRVCKIGVTYSIAIFAALTNLALLSIDCLVYIKLALKYDTIVTNRRMIIAIIIAWIFSIAISIPTLIGFGEILFSTGIGSCIMNFGGTFPYVKNRHFLIFLCIATLIPLLTLIVANVWVMCTAQKYIIKRLRERMRAHSKNESKPGYCSTAQINLIKVYAAVFLTYIFTWFLVSNCHSPIKFASKQLKLSIQTYVALLCNLVAI